MDKYLRYTANNNSSDIQVVDLPTIYEKSDIRDITEHSTPKEMANFITKKLVEVIEQELNTNKDLSVADK
jgi:hypothetical protein